MPHNEISIKFEVDGRRYQAVGFLNMGQSFVNSDIMFQRTSEANGGAIGEEDWEFLWERRTQSWSKKLWRYCLVTARRDPANPQRIYYFERHTDEWHHGWNPRNVDWTEIFLVVSRCA